MKAPRLAILLILAAAAFPGCAEDPSEVTPGLWGGEHVAMDVGPAGATIQWDCAHGSIDEPLRLTGAAFDLPGRYVQEHGGPSMEGEVLPTFPARYRGRLSGSTLDLEVSVQSDSPFAASYRLQFGDPGRVFRCL